MKLGSLFDGSGGFPLAGSLCGIEPTWASEVEPYPIAVTRSRFPKMKHLGDISKIDGSKVEPVDIITFGSPCQDLSVAGNRAGLKHEANGDEETTRSGLFMEAVRIIKEMKEETNGKYPSFALWENVPGAFSSNGGEDFRIVLEELIKIVEPTAVMPAVPKNGWPYADSYRGNGWSLAYRVFDAQYWGVPQRRRRIHLVLDLRGERAREVLFEREGVRGYFAEGRTPREEIAGDVGSCVETADRERAVPYTLKIRSGCEGGGKGALIQTDKSATLATNKACTLNADRPGLEPSVCVKEVLPFDTTQVTSPMNYSNPKWGDPCHPLAAQGHPPAAVLCMAHGQANAEILEDKCPCLNCNHEQPIVAGVDCRNMIEHPELYPTLQAKPNGGQSLNFMGAVRVRYIVRRLTPTECARLQGFADRWGDIDPKTEFSDEEYRFWLEVRNTHATVIGGKEAKEYTKEQMLTWYNKLHTDSSEYKMWGNGIALPPALYVLQGIADALQRVPKRVLVKKL